MFTIKMTPKDTMDIYALAARAYKKEMGLSGYNLFYTPFESPEGVWSGLILSEGDVAYVENAAGKTIDKVEGYGLSNVLTAANPGTPHFTQRSM